MQNVHEHRAEALRQEQADKSTLQNALIITALTFAILGLVYCLIATTTGAYIRNQIRTKLQNLYDQLQSLHHPEQNAAEANPEEP